MATDKSQPRSGLIMKIGVLAVGTLIVVHAALVAYFDAIAHAEERRKLGEARPDALLSLREQERQRLSAGPMPIEKAIQELSSHGRKANPDISPSASRDLAPLQGWAQMPAEVPPEMAVQPTTEAVVDAGAASTGPDAGTAKPRAGDGGKPPAKNPNKP
jgi:hypothetical protein